MHAFSLLFSCFFLDPDVQGPPPEVSRTLARQRRISPSHPAASRRTCTHPRLTPAARFDMNRVHNGDASVNKRDMVGRIANDANITRAQAARAREACLAGT